MQESAEGHVSTVQRESVAIAGLDARAGQHAVAGLDAARLDVASTAGLDASIKYLIFE